MTAPRRPRLLCVDDEPKVLESLALQLGRRYEVVTAEGGEAALQAVQAGPEFVVVISDMRMPAMSGAVLLSKIRDLAPNTVRILLTGQADLESAVTAVNEGQLFRFLTKPCPPQLLSSAVEAAVEQHRLLTAEQVILEQTLQGAIKALVDVLALTHPLPFGRAMRLRGLVAQLTHHLGWKERWQVEVAALLSQLGAVALPPETAEKLFQGQILTREEEEMVARMPAVADQLLAHIPRLEAVRSMLVGPERAPRLLKELGSHDKRVAVEGTKLLHLATDYDTLELEGSEASVILARLRAREGEYEASYLDALTELKIGRAPEFEVQELMLTGLRTGMVLTEDLRMATGMLLVARGYQITESFIEKCRNFRNGAVKEPISVLVPKLVKPAFEV